MKNNVFYIRASSSHQWITLSSRKAFNECLDVNNPDNDNYRFLVLDWGRFGFDAGIKVLGACREVSQSRKSKAELVIIATAKNDANYYGEALVA